MTHRTLVTVFTMVGIGIHLAGATLAGAETDDLISGTSLVVKPGNLAKLSGKGTLDLPDAEHAPNIEGAVVRIFDSGGTAYNTYYLAPAGWKGLGKPAGAKGWKYTAKVSASDPCTAAKITPKAVTVTCKKSAVTLAPPFAGPVGVVLSVSKGAKRYCASFGGTTVKNDPTQFKATKALAPTACPSDAPAWELGDQQTLVPLGALGGLCWFPDEAAVRVPGIAAFRLISWASVCSGSALQVSSGTYLFEGPDIEHIQSATRVIADGRKSGAFDSGYAGISGLYRYSDGRLYGLYHAEDWDPSLPPNATGYPGWYGSIGEAVSDDDGATWQKLGPAITSNRPKEFALVPSQSIRGAAVPSVVADPNGRYVYTYYNEFSLVDAEGNFTNVTVGVARADVTQGPPVPGQWKKLFHGDFTEPGLGGEHDAVMKPTADGVIPLQPHATYSPRSRFYLMVIHLPSLDYVPGSPASQSGLFLAFSEDGSTWSEPKLLFHDYVLLRKGFSISEEANIVWDDDAPGQRGWLVYEHTDRVPTTGSNMVGRRIEFN